MGRFRFVHMMTTMAPLCYIVFSHSCAPAPYRSTLWRTKIHKKKKKQRKPNHVRRRYTHNSYKCLPFALVFTQHNNKGKCENTLTIFVDINKREIKYRAPSLPSFQSHQLIAHIIIIIELDKLFATDTKAFCLSNYCWEIKKQEIKERWKSK